MAAPVVPSYQSAAASNSANFTSSPAFGTPVHPIKSWTKPNATGSSILPVLLPPSALRPLAFRTFTKKHSLTLTSSALQTFATFIGKHCGSGWREEGLAEKVLEEAAKTWKKNGGSVIISGDGEGFSEMLRSLESSLVNGRIVQQQNLNRQSSFESGDRQQGTASTTLEGSAQEDSQSKAEAFSVDNEDNKIDVLMQEPRSWLKIVNAFEQPRLVYNVSRKHFEAFKKQPSLLPDTSHKTQMFRNRYNLIHQRLLRNDAFQTSTVVASRTSKLQRSSSASFTKQQSYKLTPIANLLGRNGSNHVILGLLKISPTGNLILNDLTGSIAIDIRHARPVPENGAWFAPGMIVLVEGIYEEEASTVGSGLGSDSGVGGTIGGKILAFSIGGPPCERRETTLGTTDVESQSHITNAGGFGWVDFLGVGSERATGPKMRKLERQMLQPGQRPENKNRIIMIGEVCLDDVKTLQALKKVIGVYAAEPEDQIPMVFVLFGNFVRHAVLAGGGSGGSIEYKEYFDALASILSEHSTLLQMATFIFVPGDNDPWASAFSAGAATMIPRRGLPEILTSRIKKAFALASSDAEKASGTKTQGEAIWTTNPTRLTLFGPAQEIVLFRDNISGRLRRSALNFRATESDTSLNDNTRVSTVPPEAGTIRTNDSTRSEGMELDPAVETAESHVPSSKMESLESIDAASELQAARKLVKTILDQAHLSPFPLADRPVLWDYAGSLQLYPLPTALVLTDPEAPPFALTYEGCHVMNPGSLVTHAKRGLAQWMEFDVRTKRGKAREVRF